MKNKYLLFPLAFILCSCTYGSYTMKKGKTRFLKDECSASYETFNGYIARNFNIKEESLAFTFSYHSNDTNEGKLELNISGDEEKTYSDLLNGDINFSLAPGKYKIKIIGSEHSGEFSLKW